jgi:hypothetical protein
MHPRGRWSLFVIVIPAGIIGLLLLRNVLADDAPVQALARERACEGRARGCTPHMSRLIKTPLYHEIRFSVGGGRRDVRCSRAFYVLGDYQCRVLPPEH